MYKPKYSGKVYFVSKDNKMVSGEVASLYRSEIEQRCDELNKPLKTILTDTSKLEIKSD